MSVAMPLLRTLRNSRSSAARSVIVRSVWRLRGRGPSSVRTCEGGRNARNSLPLAVQCSGTREPALTCRRTLASVSTRST